MRVPGRFGILQLLYESIAVGENTFVSLDPIQYERGHHFAGAAGRGLGLAGRFRDVRP
jgi:hypothetical protein